MTAADVPPLSETELIDQLRVLTEQDVDLPNSIFRREPFTPGATEPSTEEETPQQPSDSPFPQAEAAPQQVQDPGLQMQQEMLDALQQLLAEMQMLPIAIREALET